MADSRKMLMEKEGPLGWIIFNQPEKHNTVSQEMWQIVPEMVKEIEEGEDIRIIIPRGAGDQAFVAGTDISQFKDCQRDMDDELEYRRVSGRGSQRLTNIQKPLLAMIQGYCVGVVSRHRYWCVRGSCPRIWTCNGSCPNGMKLGKAKK